MKLKNQRLFLWLWNIANLLLFAGILNHRSVNPDVLERYDLLYAAGIGLSIALVLGVLFFSGFWLRRAGVFWEAVPRFVGFLTPFVLFAAITVLWMLPFDAYFIKLLVTFNAICLGIWVVSTVRTDESAVSQKRWQFIFAGVFVTLLIIGFFSAHYVPQEQPRGDEVGWTNYAVTWAKTGKLYYQLVAQDEFPITPGTGYWLLAYAGWLNVFGVSLASGRLFIWVVYALGCLSIATAGYRLYDRWVGLFAGIIAASSLYVLETRIIRPEIGFTIIGSLLILIYLRKHPLWALLAGWLAVLSMEFHAAGLTYVIAAAGMYYTDLLIKRRDPLRFRRFGFFVLGGIWGAAVYAQLHILVLPDPAIFFTSLVNQRGFLSGIDWGAFERAFASYAERTPLELIFIAFSVVGLIARRSEPDRLVLRFLAFCFVSYFLFVPRAEDYLIIFAPFIYIGIGALVRYALERITLMPQLAGSALAVFCLCAPFLALSIPAIHLNVFAQDQMPALVRRVRELSDTSAQVVGDFNAYWWFQDYAGFYANVLELEASRRSLDTLDGLWNEIPEVVFFTASPTFPNLPEKLESFLHTEEYDLVETFVNEGHSTYIWLRPGYRLAPAE